MTRSGRRRAMKHNRRWRIVEMVCLAVFALALFMMAGKLVSQREIAEEERDAAAYLQQMENTPKADPENSVPEPLHEVQPAIQKLLEQNDDAVGLLSFEDDRTLYVCQAEDNYYYMTHRFDGSEDPAGMVFMDYRNTLSPRSDNLILYGHNMRDGSRFGTLGKFREMEYVLQYPVFTFADLYDTVEYVPFAVFTTTVLKDDPAYFAFDQTDFADAEAFNAYVDAVRERSELDFPVEVKYGDRLLTLATCASDYERGRLVIVCRAK